MAALSRMANRDHQIRIVEGDTVMLASSLIPGNENAVYRVINGLTRWGANVVHKGNAKVHVSGHASAGELLYFYNICKPRNLMPVHGEWRHLRANADLGIATGVPRDRMVIAEDGVVVDLVDGRRQDRRQGPGRLRLRRRPRRSATSPRPRSRTAGSSARRASSRSSSWWTAAPARSSAARTSRPAAPASTTPLSPTVVAEDRGGAAQVGQRRRRGRAPAPAAHPPHGGQVGLRHLPPPADDPPGRRRGLTVRHWRGRPDLHRGAPSSTLAQPPQRVPAKTVFGWGGEFRPGNRTRKGLIESETQEGKARRARERCEGSVRSLRTQQRAKSQRQIC